MNKSKVVLVRCPDYGERRVSEAVTTGIKLLGGISQFVKPGEKILTKPNVLWGSDPAKSVTTHPAVFSAVGRLLLDAGATVTYGDSPGIGSIEAHMKKAGLKPAADALGIALADFEGGREVSHKTALQNRRFLIANGVLDADGVVSLPKLKTHGLVRLTGAVKNQFGCVPGIRKSQFHVKMPDTYVFSNMLVDLNALIKPRLYIMDAIVGMEGNGPRNGRPRAVNVLLFSTDPVALDSIACKIVNLNPEFVPTSAAGEKAGLGTYHYENIELLGDSVDSFVIRDFDVVRKPPIVASGSRIMSFIKNQICPRPVIDKSVCSSCGTCIKVCPVGSPALDWAESKDGKIPRHAYGKCIRCYCCQEMCPEGAITVKNTTLGKILFR